MRRTLNVSFRPVPRLPMMTPGKDLDAFLVAFDDFRVHFHRVAHGELRVVFAKLFRFNFFQQCLVHKSYFCPVATMVRR